MISVQHLTKRFGTTLALDDLSFEVSRGEILGFLGPNGAGKTTCIRMMTGSLTPTAGTVSIAGIDTRKDPVTARRHIGYLPETVPIYREMTVADYLEFVCRMKRVAREQKPAHIDGIISRCGLREVSHKLCGHLSKGYRQRLGLAQALIGDPDVLILDEPTSGLDPKQIIEIRELIRRLGRERTVILSSHILPEVSELCQRVIILNRGQLVAVDTPDNLDKNLRGYDAIRLEISGSGDPEALFESLAGIPGISQVQSLPPGQDGSLRCRLNAQSNADLRPTVARTVLAAGWNLHELRHEVQSLEEIFITLVTREETVVRDESVTPEETES
ncbi:MAG TPA: ABC transporter ATP-binding protein [bacterium]|nr:ABC transporter ATP-binding protein [bacterium]